MSYGKTYKRVKECIYLYLFLYTIIVRWINIDPDETIRLIISQHMFLLPCLLLISLFYFHYHYFHNIFVQTRFKSKKECLKQHYLSVLKESVSLALYQLLFAFILGFEKFNMQFILSVLMITMVVVTSYIVLAIVYITAYIIKEKFYIGYVINSMIIVFYKFFVTWKLQYGYYGLDLLDIHENIHLILANVIVIGVCLLIIKTYTRKKIQISKKYLDLVIYGILEVLSYLGGQSHYFTLSYNQMEFVDSGEAFLTLLFWILPKLYLIYICFRCFYTHYKKDLLFYMVRIKNRRKWVLQISYELLQKIMFMTIIKLFCYIVLCFIQNIDFHFIIIKDFFVYFIYLYFLIQLFMSAYLIFKDEVIINYFIGFYVLCIILNMNISMIRFVSLAYDIFSIGIYFSFIVLCHILIVYRINRDEYY